MLIESPLVGLLSHVEQTAKNQRANVGSEESQEKVEPGTRGYRYMTMRIKAAVKWETWAIELRKLLEVNPYNRPDSNETQS